MLTKSQKKEQVILGVGQLKNAQNLIFADFTGVDTQSVEKLKRELRKAGATFQVFKKRLLKLSLKEAGIDFDPTQFEAQAGTIFVKGELSDVAAPIYKFVKELAKTKKNFKVLGVYDVKAKAFLSSEQFMVIAKLPSREVLLAQLVGVLSGPIRALMYIMDELSKKPMNKVEQPKS